jgi:adenine deaminase
MSFQAATDEFAKRKKTDLTHRINQAMGAELADLVIKNVSLLNVVTGTIDISDVAITGNTIVGTYGTYHGRKEIDGTGLTAVPGFINTHLHVESAKITPDQYDRLALPHGTTTAICDPHEMANVLGVPAIEYFFKSAKNTLMDLMVQLSSCVPATMLETSGARIDAEELAKLRNHPKTIGPAEFMDIGGVLGKEDRALDKLVAFQDGMIDGHLPGITGFALNAMLACGILNDHESTMLAEAQEKLRKGVQILIREGTICKDLGVLWPLINERTSPFFSFCTDDRSPLEIVREGEIDHMIRTAIRFGADPKDVYRVASWSAAQSFGLHRDTEKWQKRGLIAPGYKADIVLLNDFQNCTINSVIKNGKVVTEESFKARPHVEPIGYNSIKIRKMLPDDFKIPAGEPGEIQDVIGLIPGKLVTEHLRLSVPEKDGFLVPDASNDLLRIAVIERHGKNGNIATGFVKGFGFTSGAIASSVGHDSHNLIVVGASEEDMALAVNTIRANQGGYAVVKDGQVLGSLALPVAGLMSDKPFEALHDEAKALRDAAKGIGSSMEDPTMMLAFLPLCVIPNLKLTDFGPVRFVAGQDSGPVLLKDQRGSRPSALVA